MNRLKLTELLNIFKPKNKTINQGSTLPSNEEKIEIIHQYAEKYSCNILVETGTYLGDTINALKQYFKTLFSIELSPSLYEAASTRFMNDKNIKLYQGDSADVLPRILNIIDGNAIFWLDGHYSAGITALGKKHTPILEEIDSIFSAKKHNHVLLIDDARCFGVEPDYPTIQELKKYILSKSEKASFSVDRDIIRVILN